MTFFEAFIRFVGDFVNLPYLFLTALLVLFGIGGCAELEKNQMTQAAKSMSTDISSAMKAGIENGIRDFQAQAGVQAINPRYHFSATVVVGTSVIVDGYVGLEGVSGQVQMAGASGRDTVPVISEPSPAPPIE